MSFHPLFLVIFLSHFPFINTNSTETGVSVLNNMKDDNVNAIKRFVKFMNNEYLKKKKSILKTSLSYELTREDHLLHKKDITMQEYEKLVEKASGQVVSYRATNEEIYDTHLRKQFEQITRLIDATLPTNFRKQLDEVYSDVNKLYTTLEVNGKEQDINDLKSQMQGMDNTTLPEFWCEIQKDVTQKIELQFIKHLSLLKTISADRGLTSPLHVLTQKEGISLFELRKEGLKVLKKLHPLLTQLYYYFRKQLPTTNINSQSHPEWKPMHINYLDFIQPNNPNLKPYPNQEDGIRNAIQEKSIGIEWANQYYYLLGFQPLNASKIIKLETPTSDRKKMAVFNLFDGDYSLIWTSDGAEEDMKNLYHGMAMIHNFMQFRNHPPILQDWPNEIIQEAIAGAASMSAFSPFYLGLSGIVNRLDALKIEVIINRQMKNLIKLFSPGALPLGVITDITIQEVYEGKLTLENLKRKWWRNIRKILKIGRPYCNTARFNVNEFGPGIVENMFYASKNLKALLSETLKYQFFQQLCIQAEQFDPTNSTKQLLYKCDLTSGNNRKAIEKLKSIMQIGNTFSWEAIFQLMTGKEAFDIQPMLNYYHPAIHWLDEEIPYKPAKELTRKILSCISS